VRQNLYSLAMNELGKRNGFRPGETVRIWQQPGTDVFAYLEEKGGVVVLRLSNHPAEVILFQEDPLQDFWAPAYTARKDYETWCQRVRLDLSRNRRRKRTSAEYARI
jgi:hypothetical protein